MQLPPCKSESAEAAALHLLIDQHKKSTTLKHDCVLYRDLFAVPKSSAPSYPFTGTTPRYRSTVHMYAPVWPRKISDYPSPDGYGHGIGKRPMTKRLPCPGMKTLGEVWSLDPMSVPVPDVCGAKNKE